MKQEKINKYYLSGKISGLSVEDYTHNFEVARNHIYYRFHTFCTLDVIINPLDIKPFLGIKSWLTYMITDLYALKGCTHCVMQKNWIDSRGACIEHYFAKFVFKLKIIYL